jgi:very-short-patch-repair endonuclease
MSRSELERTFLKLCRKAGIPRPTVNALIEGCEVDMSWPDSSLIVELDSWRYHRTRRSFEGDRRRDAKLQRARYRTLRVTDRWLITDPNGVATTVLDLR